MYAQVIDNQITQIVNEQQLRELYPSTHFPSPILESHLEGFDNWYFCEDSIESPKYDNQKEKISFNRTLQGNKVIGLFKVIDLSTKEKADVKELRWNEVKYHRNNTLSATDYLMTIDVFNSFSESDQEKITDYRKALRDLTSQADPFNIIWPQLGVESITLKYNVEI